MNNGNSKVRSAENHPQVVVSIVSHGHAAEVGRLLAELAALRSRLIARVVLTLNLPHEQAPGAPRSGWPFALQVLRNEKPLGFGANHNRALREATEDCVCVMNPDVNPLGRDPFTVLTSVAMSPGVGCAYPRQVDASGRPQDYARELPTPMALWRRRGLGRRERRVDWVNAACMVMPRRVWEAMGGFDETYYMYCEDVDLCLRMRLAGLALVRADACVQHAGQRASHRKLRHLAWHMAGLLRLWRSPVYARARAMAHDEQRADTMKRS